MKEGVYIKYQNPTWENKLKEKLDAKVTKNNDEWVNEKAMYGEINEKKKKKNFSVNEKETINDRMKSWIIK